MKRPAVSGTRPRIVDRLRLALRLMREATRSRPPTRGRRPPPRPPRRARGRLPFGPAGRVALGLLGLLAVVLGVGAALGATGDDDAAPASVEVEGVEVGGLDARRGRARRPLPGPAAHGPADRDRARRTSRTARSRSPARSLGARPRVQRAVDEALEPRGLRRAGAPRLGVASTREVPLGVPVRTRHRVKALVGRVSWRRRHARRSRPGCASPRTTSWWCRAAAGSASTPSPCAAGSSSCPQGVIRVAVGAARAAGVARRRPRPARERRCAIVAAPGRGDLPGPRRGDRARRPALGAALHARPAAACGCPSTPTSLYEDIASASRDAASSPRATPTFRVSGSQRPPGALAHRPAAST